MIAVPMLVSMDDVEPLMSRQGQPMVPLVSGDLDGTATTLLSAGVVHMQGGHASRAHCHDETDVIVLVWRSGRSGAITLYGEELEHEILQRPGEALWIPRGVPHCAVNPSRSKRIVAWEFRSNPILGVDNQLRAELEPIVTARRAVLTGRRLLSRRLWPCTTSSRPGAGQRDVGVESIDPRRVGR
jgi:uncharacterized RmlC-like cupin family protein